MSDFEPFGLSKYYKAWVDDDIHDMEHYFTLRLCYKNGWVVKKFDKDESTMKRKMLLEACPRPLITLFDNGCLHFPWDGRESVLKQIAEDISVDTPMCFNQMGYEELGFRLAIDIDSERLLSDLEIEKFESVLRKTLEVYYTGKEPIKIATSVCGPRMKNAKISTAVHFVAHIEVNILQGRQITFGYTMRMRSDPLVNMMDIVIDAGIYKPAKKMMSMRMIYSNKLDTCVQCRNDTFERQSCELCKSRGMVVSTFVYVPKFFTVGRDQEAFDEAHKDFLSTVKTHSIWSESGDVRDDYVKPSMDPDVPDDSKKRKPSESKKTTNATKKLLTNACYEALEEQIRAVQIGGEYVWKDLIVKEVDVNAKGTAMIRVSGISSSYCLYSKTSHGSRTFYFLLNKKGIMTLRCGSDKHKCDVAHKDPERVISFTVSQRVTNDIFGVANAPSLDTPQGIYIAPTTNSSVANRQAFRQIRNADLVRHLHDVYKIPFKKK
jgi:hypothetical protein